MNKTLLLIAMLSLLLLSACTSKVSFAEREVYCIEKGYNHSFASNNAFSCHVNHGYTNEETITDIEYYTQKLVKENNNYCEVN